DRRRVPVLVHGVTDHAQDLALSRGQLVAHQDPLVVGRRAPRPSPLSVSSTQPGSIVRDRPSSASLSGCRDRPVRHGSTLPRARVEFKHLFESVLDPERVFDQHGAMQPLPPHPTGPPRPSAAPPLRLPLPPRGLLLLIALAVALLTVVVTVPGIALGGGRGQAQPTFESVTQPGDTAWGLARRLAPDRDPRPLVDQLLQVNDVHGPLRAGQRLRLLAPL